MGGKPVVKSGGFRTGGGKPGVRIALDIEIELFEGIRPHRGAHAQPAQKVTDGKGGTRQPAWHGPDPALAKAQPAPIGPDEVVEAHGFRTGQVKALPARSLRLHQLRDGCADILHGDGTENLLAPDHRRDERQTAQRADQRRTAIDVPSNDERGAQDEPIQIACLERGLPGQLVTGIGGS